MAVNEALAAAIRDDETVSGDEALNAFEDFPEEDEIEVKLLASVIVAADSSPAATATARNVTRRHWLQRRRCTLRLPHKRYILSRAKAMTHNERRVTRAEAMQILTDGAQSRHLPMGAKHAQVLSVCNHAWETVRNYGL